MFSKEMNIVTVIPLFKAGDRVIFKLSTREYHFGLDQFSKISNISKNLKLKCILFADNKKKVFDSDTTVDKIVGVVNSEFKYLSLYLYRPVSITFASVLKDIKYL